MQERTDIFQQQQSQENTKLLWINNLVELICLLQVLSISPPLYDINSIGIYNTHPPQNISFDITLLISMYSL